MGLVSCGVACLGEASGFGRLSDSRYVLIPDLIEAVKEIPFDPEPDDRMERGSIAYTASPVVCLKKWLC